MHAERTSQESRPKLAWVSLTLALILLALSMVLLAGLVYAQTGSISGTVTYYGSVPPGTYHLNVDYFTDPNQPPIGGINLPGSGDYTLGGLPDDIYYVCVSVYTGPSTSPYTCYDPDDDGETDPIIVSGGGAVIGIDINLGGPWLPLGGPMAEGGQVNALAVQPAIAGTVYAAVAPLDAYDTGPSVIYKSTDGAASWTPVYTAEHQVYSLAADGANVYAGAFNRGGKGPSIYASGDSGVSWTPVYSFPRRGVLLDVAVHPADPDVAIAGGWLDDGTNRDEGVVYGTEDGGLTWTSLLTMSVPDDNASINAVLIHPTTPTVVLAAGHAEGEDGVIYRSEDGGATWSGPITTWNAQFISLAAHGSNPNMLYAGTTNDRFAQGPSRVFRSTDVGKLWTEVYGGAGGRLAFEPPHTIYGVTYSGRVSRSTSDGDPGTWSQVGHSGGGLAFDIDLGLSPVGLYAGAWNRVSKSTDGGVNWEERNSGIEQLVTPRDIDVDPKNLDKLFVAARNTAGWMTDDGGETWGQPAGIGDAATSFAINPGDSDIVYAGITSCHLGTILRSEDGGVSFTQVYTPPLPSGDCSVSNEGIHALAVASSRTSTVYGAGWFELHSAGNQAVVVRSLDDGVSWTEVFTLPPRSQVETLAIDPSDDDVVYAGGNDCSGQDCHGFIYRTTDGGETWDQTLVTTDTVSSIVINSLNPKVLYAGDLGSWIRKSIDGGDTWTVVRDPWWVHNEPSGHLLAIDPHAPSHVYLGGWGYIAETVDGGQTWSGWGAPLTWGTPDAQPMALTVDNGAVTQTIYAGWNGVWAYKRPAPQPLHVYLPLVLKSYKP